MARAASFSLTRVLAAFVPALLLTLVLAFSIASATSNSWALRSNYNTLKNPPEYLGHFTRSPFGHCSPNSGPPYASVGCSHSSKPGFLCNPVDADSPAFCDQLKLTGRLVIVGATFAGVAFALAWILFLAEMFAPSWLAFATTASGSGHHRRNRHHRRHKTEDADGNDASTVASTSPVPSLLSMSLLIFTIISVVALALASLIGGNLLTNLSPPNGSYTGAGKPVGTVAGWRLSTGFRFVSASWILAAFACFFVDAVWSSPRGYARSGYAPVPYTANPEAAERDTVVTD